jgi:hypothetical protein
LENILSNKNKIILDLCGGTGSWSQPYNEAGYSVKIITLPDHDVMKYKLPKNKTIYGILAAPPCTDFSVSGAQYWKQKDIDGRTINSMAITMRCLAIIAQAQPTFWALENPKGRLSKWIGKPQLIFDPCDYGDPWTKRTLIWGRFNDPIKTPIYPEGQWTGRADQNGICDHLETWPSYNWIMKLPPSKDRAALRSVTPPGFAKAFFEANQ